jgi:RNA polymerase sigma factor (sigma-70 family)
MYKHDPRATRPSLLLRIRDANDSDSWADFVTVYGPLIRGYCRLRGLQEADADDVSQEVLTQVARSIGSFDYEPGRGRFRDWLGAVTRNKIIRFLEIKGRGGPAAGLEFASVQLSSAGEDPEWLAEFHAPVLEAALVRIRDGFEAATWDAFERIWGGDHSAREVAQSLGMTIDAVYAAKSRVLRRLREEVLSLADDLPSAFSRAESRVAHGRGVDECVPAGGNAGRPAPG